MPRGSLIVGPFWGLERDGSAGQGVRSIDPIYITQDAKTPFASVTAYEGGLTFERRIADRLDLAARSVVFDTKVDHDLIFSQTAGRNTLARPDDAARLGLDAAAHRLVLRPRRQPHLRAAPPSTTRTCSCPTCPTWCFAATRRSSGRCRGAGRAGGTSRCSPSLAVGVTYVGPRPLPYGERSDTIFTVDASATLRWWMFETGFSAQNLLDRQVSARRIQLRLRLPLAAVPHAGAGAPVQRRAAADVPLVVRHSLRRSPMRSLALVAVIVAAGCSGTTGSGLVTFTARAGGPPTSSAARRSTSTPAPASTCR